MEKTEKIKINAPGWVMIAISIMILFTCGFLTALVGIDYGPHEQIALSLTPGDPVGLCHILGVPCPRKGSLLKNGT